MGSLRNDQAVTIKQIKAAMPAMCGHRRVYDVLSLVTCAELPLVVKDERTKSYRKGPLFDSYVSAPAVRQEPPAVSSTTTPRLTIDNTLTMMKLHQSSALKPFLGPNTDQQETNKPLWFAIRVPANSHIGGLTQALSDHGTFCLCINSTGCSENVRCLHVDDDDDGYFESYIKKDSCLPILRGDSYSWMANE